MKWLWAALGGVALVLVWEGVNPLLTGSGSADEGASATSPPDGI